MMKLICLTRKRSGEILAQMSIDGAVIDVVFSVDSGRGVGLINAQPNVFNGYPISLEEQRALISAVSSFDAAS